MPEMVRQPEEDTIQVPGSPAITQRHRRVLTTTHSALFGGLIAEGSINWAISVEGSGAPAPSYQWERLLPIVNDTAVDIPTSRFYDGDDNVRMACAQGSSLLLWYVAYARSSVCRCRSRAGCRTHGG
jgi:hypothetical protein